MSQHVKYLHDVMHVFVIVIVSSRSPLRSLISQKNSSMVKIKIRSKYEQEGNTSSFDWTFVKFNRVKIYVSEQPSSYLYKLIVKLVQLITFKR